MLTLIHNGLVAVRDCDRAVAGKCFQLQAGTWIMPAVPHADGNPDMAGEDVGAPGAADAGIQASVMRAEPLHLHAIINLEHCMRSRASRFAKSMHACPSEVQSVPQKTST